MKQTAIFVLTAVLALGLLAGCGELRDDRAPSTALPGATETLPGGMTGDERILPDPKDGEVRDTDGIIDDDDSGAVTGEQETDRKRTGTAADGTDGTNAKNGANGTDRTAR